MNWDVAPLLSEPLCLEPAPSCAKSQPRLQTPSTSITKQSAELVRAFAHPPPPRLFVAPVRDGTILANRHRVRHPQKVALWALAFFFPEKNRGRIPRSGAGQWERFSESLWESRPSTVTPNPSAGGKTVSDPPSARISLGALPRSAPGPTG